MVIGPRHHRAAAFQGLTQGFQRLTAEFRQFVEKQHATVGQGYLAGFGPCAAAHQGREGGGMVWIAERSRRQ